MGGDGGSSVSSNSLLTLFVKQKPMKNDLPPTISHSPVAVSHSPVPPALDIVLVSRSLLLLPPPSRLFLLSFFFREPAIASPPLC
jgi:hypothetical protein